MKRLNLGCGPDILEGWVNVDSKDIEGASHWDFRNHPPEELFDRDSFDFVLINHVLCTMKPSDTTNFILNAKFLMKPGAKIQIIDMDLLEAYRDYIMNDGKNIPIDSDDKDTRLCLHLSGYGTRLSLYTAKSLMRSLEHLGFKDIKQLPISKYDTRPNESLIIEATA